MSLLPAWLIAFGGFATAVFLVADTAQRFLYDEVVPHLGLRTLALAVPYSFLLVLWKPEIGAIDSMAGKTVVHFLLLFPAVWLVLRFQWPHALAVAALVSFIGYPILWLAMDRFVGGGQWAYSGQLSAISRRAVSSQRNSSRLSTFADR